MVGFRGGSRASRCLGFRVFPSLGRTNRVLDSSFRYSHFLNIHPITQSYYVWGIWYWGVRGFIIGGGGYILKKLGISQCQSGVRGRASIVV